MDTSDSPSDPSPSPSPSTSSSSIERRCASASEWQARIKSNQLARATPEVLQRIQESAERQRQIQMARQQAQYLSRVNFVQSASSARTLSEFSSIRSKVTEQPAPASSNVFGLNIFSINSAPLAFASAPSRSSSSNNNNEDDEEEEVHKEYAKARNDSSRRYMSINKAMSASSNYARSKHTAKVRKVVNEDDMMDDEDEGLRELRAVEEELGVVGNNATSRDATFVTLQNDLRRNIHQLAHEPTDPVEVEAKFALFESASETVSNIRQQTLQFWEENKVTFTGNSHGECLKDIRKIDSEENMGIVEDPRQWFIYSMTKKCNDNSVIINEVLARFRSRLEILSQEPGDCPFCLEPMSGDAITVLSCCHRVCNECWDHWSEVKGSEAFCPLCRHTEFVQELGNL